MTMTANLAAILYIISGILFIMALRGLSSPASSRRGNVFGMIGIAIAIVTTMLFIGMSGMGLILTLVALAIGGGLGALIAKKIPMTDMPQLIAGFHSLVGLAAVFVAIAAFFAPQNFGIGEFGHIHSVSLLNLRSARPLARSPLVARSSPLLNSTAICPARPSCLRASIWSTSYSAFLSRFLSAC